LKIIAGLTEDHVYYTFGETYTIRGEAYERQQKVKNMQLDVAGRMLTGEVEGSRIKAYSVRLHLDRTFSKILSYKCTCPMGGMCKHSAALALHAIYRSIFSRLQINGEIQSSVINSDKSQTHVTQEESFSQSKPLSSTLERWLTDVSKALADAQSEAVNAQSAKTAPRPQTDSILYILESVHDRLAMYCLRSRKLKSGAWGGTQAAQIPLIAAKKAQYVTVEDATICSAFSGARHVTGYHYTQLFPEDPEISASLIERIIATGRCFWGKVEQPISTFAPAKQTRLSWAVLEAGSQILKFSSDSENDIVVIAGSIWYVNPKECEIGPLTTGYSPDVVQCILQMPKVREKEAAALSQAMKKAGLNIPHPVSKFKIKTEVVKPRPRLLLRSEDNAEWNDGWDADDDETRYSTIAELHFDYGDIKFEYDNNNESRVISGDEIHVRRKDLDAERRFFALVDQHKLGEVYSKSEKEPDVVVFDMFIDDDERWLKFVQTGIPALEAEGFTIEADETFKYKILAAEEEWDVDATSGTGFWFSLDLGVLVDDKRVPLFPIVHKAIQHLQGIGPHLDIDHLNIDGKFYAPLPDGGFVALPFDRVKAVIYTLLEIFDERTSIKEAAAQVNIPQILELATQLGFGTASGASRQGPFSNSSALSSLLQRISNYDGLKTITPPSTFKAELRPYQLEGLSWLDFIREFGLGGILADDMGLGKTIQTLAHVACEKKANRVTKPYLVICPTSVLPNWQSEIKKFAPTFKTLALTGADRMLDFKKIARADIVITTYPLVPRDIGALQEQDWQAVILDEAQYIKNPQTQVAQAVQLLRSEYRLCLTGTPIENHLGERWSKFNFLMPGFLRDLKTFNKTVRTPIEKQKNKFIQNHLAKKVRPFLLRRTKEVVAKDLPEKTEIIKSVELEGAQRDLYESVRLAMYEKVKDALAEKGLARSQIVILDALLKLRQVCCDPRLVKLPTAKQVTSSAKLDQLLEMIDELVSEGKRILLFSQFTSMLGLIEPELDKRKIAYVQIRGDTKDRATPVKQFQNGKVPLFLLSLKAGGTGLNLTAADTVIHYDPWWNPAVENQATDRAHRIGQKKKVFVFKLIAAGTIEEKMIELQEKKRKIANAIYGDEEELASKLTAEELAELFTPLK